MPAELETVCVIVVDLIYASDNATGHAEIADLPLKVRGGLKMKKNVVFSIVEYGCSNGTSTETDVVESFRTPTSFVGRNKKGQ